MFPSLFSLSSPCYQSLRWPTPEDAAEDGGVVRRDVTQIPHHYHTPIVWRLRQLISKHRERRRFSGFSVWSWLLSCPKKKFNRFYTRWAWLISTGAVGQINSEKSESHLPVSSWHSGSKNLPRHQPRPELHRPSCSRSRQTSTSFQKLPANPCCSSVLVMQVEGPGAADTWPVSRLHLQASFYISSLGGDRWGHKGSEKFVCFLKVARTRTKFALARKCYNFSEPLQTSS